MKLDRRNFIGSSAAIAAALSAPTVMAGGKPRVVVARDSPKACRTI